MFSTLRRRLAAAAATMILAPAMMTAAHATTADNDGFFVWKEVGANDQWIKTNTLDNALGQLGTDPGVIYVPTGTHTLTGTVNLYDEQAIIGREGAVLYTTSTSMDMITVNGDDVDIQYLELKRDLGGSATAWSSVSGDAINTNGHDGIEVKWISSSYHENFITDPSTGNGESGGGSDSDGLELFYATAQYIKNNFVDFDNSTDHTDCYMRFCVAINTGGDAVAFNSPATGTSFCSVEQCLFRDCNGNALDLTGNNWVIRENLITGAYTNHAIEISGAKNVEIHSGYIDGAGLTVTMPANTNGTWTYGSWVTANGVNLASTVEDARIHDVDVSYNADDGIYVNGAKDVKINNVSAHSNGQRDAAGVPSAGIRLVGAFSDVIVANNRTFNDSALTAANKFQKYGFRVDFSSGGNYLNVVDNNFHDRSGSLNQTSDYKQDSASPSNFVRDNNIIVTYTTVAQSITAVGNAIVAGGTDVLIDPNGNYTLTSAPTIANGYAGQVITLRLDAAEANTVTLQDQNTLANSNLQLQAASRALSARDTLVLMFDGSDWVEVAYANN